jgi:hypothetical protein
MLYVILILLVVLPVAWLISEFQPRRWLRVTLGISSLTLSFIVAWAVGMLSHLQYNAWYGSASSQLIDTVVANIEAGKTDELLEELRKLKADFQPTYENRAHYDILVGHFAERLRTEKPVEPPRPSGGK